MPPNSETTHRLGAFKKRRGVEAALEYAIELSHVPGGGRPWHILTLLGGTGCGKTHLAMAVAWEWIGQGVAACYTTVAALLDQLRKAAMVNADTAGGPFTLEMVMQQWKLLPLAVLDELGMQKDTDFGLDKLDQIVDWRYGRGMPTILCSNLTGEQLREQYPRIADRILDVHLARVASITAESYRRRVG